MRTFYLSIIPALWLIWLAYWIAAAIGAKETQREEGLRSRLTHHVPLILGGVLLGWPGIAGAQLEQRFTPASLTWFWWTVAVIAIGFFFVLGVVRKIGIEERFMSEQFGDTYARYRAQVPALVPFLL